MRTEQQLQVALAEIERLKAEVHVRAVTNARYPWENPEVVRVQPRMTYNIKIEPELYLQIRAQNVFSGTGGSWMAWCTAV